MTQENVLARYKVLHELGRGAISAVYAARDRTTGAVVALKRLDPALSKEPDTHLAERFLKRARSARLLRHRNIVETYDAGEAGGTAYVAMEMLEGESLRGILDRGPLPMARAIRIAHDIASGLEYAHLQGAVHGGIQPSDVIVLRSGMAKITDFGIGQAALLPAAPGGRASYISPEQLLGEPVDHRCDVFSLGALFYEMLTGRTPSQGASPKPPSELNPLVPRALDAIVCSMLAAQPAGRMAGMPLLVRDLQRLEEGLGLGTGPRPGGDEPAASVPPAAPAPPVRPSASEALQPDPRISDREVFDYQAAIALMERESRPQRSSRSRPAVFAAFALVLAALGVGLAGFLDTGVTGFMADWLSRSEQSIAALFRDAPATAPMAARPAAPPPVAEATQEPVAAPTPVAARPAAPPPVAEKAQEPVAAPTPVAPPPVAEATPAPVAAPPPVAEAAPEPVAAPVPEPVAPQPLAPEPSPPARAQTAKVAEPAKVVEPQPGATAQLVVAVSPRGEIYIDGKHHGTTPPITKVDLEPGMRQIEIRSGSRKPYLTYMVVQPGDVRRIRHDFNAKPSGPGTAKASPR
jgi:serine/threonine-protein kinase